jgi:hypothetical protein
MSDEILRKMRARVEMCRRLAKTITDPRAAKILRQMADEGEADIKRLEAEEAARSEDLKPDRSS